MHARHGWFLLAAMSLFTPVVAGCRGFEYKEHPLTLKIDTVPPGATIAASTPVEGGTRLLGIAPVMIDSLAIVRRRYPSGAVDYWLRDAEHRLPPHPAKPNWSSGAYLAGNDYPLQITFAASLGDGSRATRRLLFDRALLRRLFEQEQRELSLKLELRKRKSAAAGGGDTALRASLSRDE